jgi:hypothetical protein
LFIDQDAIPTFVEVKRAADTRARREVVAQMLDYAANGSSYWTVNRLQEVAARNASPGDPSLDDRVVTLLGPSATLDVDRYWKTVEENLRRGRVRLIFVLDEAPRELRRLTEFLNEQMRETDVFLLEIKQFKGTTDLHALVPRLIGRTERAASTKADSPRQKPLADILAALGRRSDAEVRAAKQILDYWRDKGAEIDTTSKGFIPRFRFGETDYYPFRVTEGGGVTIYFMYLKKTPAFESDGVRRELVKRLNDIPGVILDQDSIVGKPSIPLALLIPEASMTAFLSVVDWLIDLAKGNAPSERVMR